MDIFFITLIWIHGAFVSIEETAKAADFFRADGLIVTGSATGDPASPQEVISVVDYHDCDSVDLFSQLKSVMDSGGNLPVLVGSGVTPDNLQSFSSATALIIG